MKSLIVMNSCGIAKLHVCGRRRQCLITVVTDWLLSNVPRSDIIVRHSRTDTPAGRWGGSAIMGGQDIVCRSGRGAVGV